MALRKTLLICGMALAVIAFAVPAMAQAGDVWFTDIEVEESSEEITLGMTTAEGDEIELTGTLASTQGALRDSCEVHMKAYVWNRAVEGVSRATAEVEEMTHTTPCTVAVFVPGVGAYVDIPGCVVSEVISEAFPWHVYVATQTKKLHIVDTNFIKVYSGCAALGLPNGVKLGFLGTITGTWNNTTRCIEFSNSGDLKNSIEEAVLLDGSLCSGGLTLK